MPWTRLCRDCKEQQAWAHIRPRGYNRDAEYARKTMRKWAKRREKRPESVRAFRAGSSPVRVRGPGIAWSVACGLATRTSRTLTGMCVTWGLRPAKLHENGSEVR